MSATAADEGCLPPKPRSQLRRWWKFNFVGGIGMIVQFAVLFVLNRGLHLNYLIATLIAVEAAVMHNFVWHEQFTWADRTPPAIDCAGACPGVARRMLRFHLANGAISILGNLALMRLMVGRGHVNYLAANAIAIALCSAANFLLSEKWVFA